MQIKKPLTTKELLELVIKIEDAFVDGKDVVLSSDDAEEVCDALRNFLMIKVTTDWRKQ